MAFRSGLGAQLGISTEETYGTYKAPTTFLPFESESLALTQNYVESRGLKANQMVQAKNLHLATTKIVGGSLSLEFLDQGMGKFLNLLHGNSASPSKVSETEKTYKQVHEIGRTEPYSKSATIQVGRPDTGGTVRPFSYVGCALSSFGLSIDTGGIGMTELEVVGQDEKTGEALASATYDTDALPFTFQQMEVKVAGSKASNVRTASLSVAVPQPERYLIGSTALTARPIVDDYADVSANATLEFASLADHERFLNSTVVTFLLIAKGSEIESGQYMKAELELTASKQISSSPTVGGPDIVTQDVQFKGLDDGSSAPLKITVYSTDSSL